MRRVTPDILGDVLATEPGGENQLAIRQQLQWDYSQVSPLHRKEVEDAAVDIAVSGRRMTASVMAIGAALMRAKKLLAHGQFEDWCRVEFGMSERTAQNMMNVTRTFDGKSEKISLLSDSTLYLLAAPSTPEAVREAVIEQAERTGVSPSVAEVKKEIERVRNSLEVRRPVFLNIEDWQKREKAGRPDVTVKLLEASADSADSAEEEAEIEERPWAAAVRPSAMRGQRVAELSAAMLPWIEVWTDDKGRTWRDVAEKNPQHFNSPFFQDVLRECQRQQVPVLEPVIQDAIRAAFAKLQLATPITPVPDDRIGQAIRLIGIYNLAISTADEYGELTGCHTETLAPKRELQKLIDRLQRMVDLLEGRAVEPMEACD